MTLETDEYLSALDAAKEFGVAMTSISHLGRRGHVRMVAGIPGRGHMLVKGYHRGDLESWYASPTSHAGRGSGVASTDVVEPCVYIVVQDPVARPTRVKVGSTDSLNARLSSFRTVCPEVHVLSTYSVPRSCEGYALALAHSMCSQSFVSSPEVFDFTDDSLKDFLDVLDNAFSSITLTDDLGDEPSDEPSDEPFDETSDESL